MDRELDRTKFFTKPRSLWVEVFKDTGRWIWIKNWLGQNFLPNPAHSDRRCIEPAEIKMDRELARRVFLRRLATLIQKLTCCSGLGPGCQWSNYSWPGIQFPSVAYIKHVASPEFFRDFWVLIWCTFSQTGLYQDVPLPQPGILRESWKFVGCTSSQPGLFLDVPLLQPGMLREAL